MLIAQHTAKSFYVSEVIKIATITVQMDTNEFDKFCKLVSLIDNDEIREEITNLMKLPVKKYDAKERMSENKEPSRFPLSLPKKKDEDENVPINF